MWLSRNTATSLIISASTTVHQEDAPNPPENGVASGRVVPEASPPPAEVFTDDNERTSRRGSTPVDGLNAQDHRGSSAEEDQAWAALAATLVASPRQSAIGRPARTLGVLGMAGVARDWWRAPDPSSYGLPFLEDGHDLSGLEDAVVLEIQSLKVREAMLTTGAVGGGRDGGARYKMLSFEDFPFFETRPETEDQYRYAMVSGATASASPMSVNFRK